MTSTILPPSAVYALTDIRAHDVTYPGYNQVLVPAYVAEGKSHLTIAIGCTGGRHRSVAIAEHLARRWRARDDVFVEVVHRDVTRADRRDGDRAAS